MSTLNPESLSIMDQAKHPAENDTEESHGEDFPRRYRVLVGFSVAMLVVLVLVASIIFFISYRRQQLEKRFAPYIEQAAIRNNVDPDLIRAIIMQESKYRESARGQKKEMGLMQITPLVVKDWEISHHRVLSSRDAIFVPETNIEIGSWFLGMALREWDEHENPTIMALAQYNAGRSRALDWADKLKGKNVLDHIPFKSTRHYIKNVLNYRDHYHKKRVKSQ